VIDPLFEERGGHGGVETSQPLGLGVDPLPADLKQSQFVLGHPDVAPVLIPVGEAGRLRLAASLTI
jgi:hypothetical protein